MSLDVMLFDADGKEIYSRNITHNLNKMADAAGIYEPLWHPGEIGLTTAKQVADNIRSGVADIASNGAKYKAYDAPNGWGKWADFVPFLTEYLCACDENPTATVSVSI